MRFASLGSGSRGNALVVEADTGGVKTRVLMLSATRQVPGAVPSLRQSSSP